MFSQCMINVKTVLSYEQIKTIEQNLEFLKHWNVYTMISGGSAATKLGLKLHLFSKSAIKFNIGDISYFVMNMALISFCEVI